MIKPIQIVSRFDHSLVALCGSGQLFALERGKWKPVSPPEDASRIASIAVRPNGSLVAIDTAGRVFEQYRAGIQAGDFSQGWRPVPPLPET